ncbi:DinB family protein [Ferruginibacter sp. HRS2-29]|uniref:DinB family protein n=1 Tax=Ferruginibacter sp. HRS2-29 TaxID=2487334 RepID=UPI0020CEAF86|nr:DinB family protein [Ferruginibacter sp. HRS2-29]MCP9753090.1 DinB family protein [Ferruginibacter sp. HRS2-29]
MTQIQLIQQELENESLTTRKMLSIVPDDKYDWKPHPKSMTIRQLATHIAELPTWIPMILNTSELDFANNPYAPMVINDTKALLEYFEKSLQEARNALVEAKDADLEAKWVLRNGDQIYSDDPKRVMIRITSSQIIHHRAQLGVFLRLLDIPIPGSYGPSADDVSF